MNARKLLALCLTATLLIAPLSSCGEEGNDPNEPGSFTLPSEITTDPVLVADGSEQAEAAEAIFSGVVEAGEEELSVAPYKNGVTLLSYTGTAEKLRLPDTVGGKPLLAISDAALRDAANLTVLVLPDSIVSIGEGILSGCTALSALQTPLMGKSVTDKQYLGYLFGADSYRNNPRDVPVSLKHIRLTQSADTLPAYALYDCNDLVTVSLPKTLRVIEKFAFYRCTRLELLIGADAVTEFGEYALANCSSLFRLDFGAGLVKCGLGMLEGCSALESLTLPFVGETTEENTYLGYLFGAKSPDFAKGYYPAKLSRVTLTAPCKGLGNYAFYECESLREIVLPEGIETIGVRAFYGCHSLWSVKLPHTLRVLRENAFFGCKSLLSVSFGEGLEKMGINCFYDCIRLEELTLPEHLRTIPASAFAGCVSLQAVDLGGVETVGKNAFRGCYSIRLVTAPDSIRFEDGNHALIAILYPEE